MQILVVEDEPKIAAFVKKGLTEQKYSVDLAADGAIALEKCDTNTYDLIILDIMLPKIDGLSLCRQLRSNHYTVPILLLTAKDEINTKVTGLDSGADDYVVKPFVFAELSARVRALLRRPIESKPITLSVGDLQLDQSTRLAIRHHDEINLTTREFALLEFLMLHPNQVLTKSEIIDHVWDANYDGLSNIVETYIKYVRQKIRIHPWDNELIHTIRGVGYTIKEPK